MRVIVVGGGLSGLFTASELVAAGIEDVVVLDDGGSPGGVAQTIERDGFTLEPAVGSVSLPHPHLSPMLDRIGAVTEPAGTSSSMRYVYTGGRLVELPASPRAVFARVMPLGSKLRALAEPLVRANPHSRDETLQAFCKRRFGKEAGRMIAWLMAAGVYAGDPRALSARSAFPMLVDLEAMHGSVMMGALRSRRDRLPGVPRPHPHVPVGGMSALARSAVGYLGDRYRAGFEVDTVRREGDRWIVAGPESLAGDCVVLACRPGRAAQLVDGDLGAHLEEATSAPVVVVGLGGEGNGIVPAGFGALIGPSEGMVSRGVLFESSYAPGYAPAGSWLVKVIAGGAIDTGIVEWDDDRLVQRVGEETARLMGTDLDATFVEVVRHTPGIPQYTLGHGRWLAHLDHLLSERPGLHVTGWGYRGVGVARLAADAGRLSSAIATELGP